jgi:hypothetical protein
MSNLIPFDTGNLPAYLKSADVAQLNSDLLAHGSAGGFPVISIKGKIFAVKRDGVRTIVPNPRDPESAATSIEVVLLKVNKNKSKVFYATGWKEGDDSKPTCFSNDGKAPDTSVEKPQSKSCAACKHNQWGSKISDSGTKLKSCADSIRMAVAPVGQINDPMLLRVPAASMSAVGEYGSMLAKRGAAYNAVATRVGFDIEAPTPKLTFKAVGYLSESDYLEAKNMAESEVVDNIVNGGSAVGSDSESLDPPTKAERVIGKIRQSAESNEVTEADIDDSIARAVSAPEPQETKTKTKTKTRAADIEVDVDLSDLDFDD